MKRILLTLTIASLALSCARAQTEVSLNFFYDNLSPYGDWVEVGDYGYCFQPYVAEKDSAWRPYADGYWAYTDAGWTWVSYEDFGWATYHYGRWTRLADLGWVWVPGYEWGPAWVSWRTGGDYVGWAPLPPAAERVYEGHPIAGHVDVEFDIGPLYYNFVDVRYIAEPVLRQRIIEPQRNVTIINRTVNVTNITYNNSVVYNYGPDVNRLDQYSTRRIQRLTLQRETNVTNQMAAQNSGHNLNRVNNNQLVVFAPPIQKPQQNIAPKKVKTKVAQPKIERGWQGIDRAKVEAEMKKENPKNVPPPSFQPQKERPREAAGASQQPAAPTEQAGAAAATPNPNPPAAGQREPRRRGAKRAPGPQPATSPAANEPETAVNPAAQQQPNEQRTPERRRKARPEGGETAPAGPSPRSMSEQGAQPSEQGPNENPEHPRKARREGGETAPAGPSPRSMNEQGAQPSEQGPNENPEHPRKARERRPEQTQPETPQQPNEPPAHQARRGPRAQSPQPGNETPANPGNEPERKGKKKKPAASPTPPPQG